MLMVIAHFVRRFLVYLSAGRSGALSLHSARAHCGGTVSVRIGVLC
ncbi:hypothetical protein EDD55_108157 [Varunaivibrio sulfuroxidans]|uniref:Uncharacterized protein n=1 Tax=Varunaivibrio sulfuroxidans TaxID=1773489 RepID=A0A4R3J7L6_9PROT|nr:hypothetical protein EDD55_108157 [Varunaivibrio sulfuroxidans]